MIVKTDCGTDGALHSTSPGVGELTGGGGGPLRVRVPGDGEGGGALPGHPRPALHVAAALPALPPGKQSKISSVTVS